MTPAEIAAIMDDTNIGIGQWRKLVKSFKAYFQLEKFRAPEKSCRELGEDNGKIKNGEHAYKEDEKSKERAEIIKWWMMDAVDELNSHLRY